MHIDDPKKNSKSEKIWSPKKLKFRKNLKFEKVRILKKFDSLDYNSFLAVRQLYAYRRPKKNSKSEKIWSPKKFKVRKSSKSEKVQSQKKFKVRKSSKSKIFEVRKFLKSEKFRSPKIFEVQKFLKSKNFWSPKIFEVQKFLKSENFWSPKIFEVRKFLKSKFEKYFGIIPKVFFQNSKSGRLKKQAGSSRIKSRHFLDFEFFSNLEIFRNFKFFGNIAKVFFQNSKLDRLKKQAGSSRIKGRHFLDFVHIWQPCSMWHFSKLHHSIGRSRKHGHRHQNYVLKCTPKSLVRA